MLNKQILLWLQEEDMTPLHFSTSELQKNFKAENGAAKKVPQSRDKVQRRLVERVQKIVRLAELTFSCSSQGGNSSHS